MWNVKLYRSPTDPPANPYAEPSTTSAEPAATGPTPLLAGKYKTEKELIEGHENLQHTLTERTNELRVVTERAQQLEKVLMDVAERMSPADRARSRSQAEELLENQGLPLSALEEVINERATKVASRILDEKLAPLTQGAQTQQMLEEEFPGISRADVDQFLRANPEIRQRYLTKLNDNVQSAMYFAYAQYTAAGQNRDLSGHADAQARARRDAELPAGESGGRRGAGGEEGPSLADRFEKWAQTGDPNAKTEFLLQRLAHIPGIKPRGQ